MSSSSLLTTATAECCVLCASVCCLLYPKVCFVVVCDCWRMSFLSHNKRNAFCTCRAPCSRCASSKALGRFIIYALLVMPDPHSIKLRARSTQNSHHAVFLLTFSSMDGVGLWWAGAKATNYDKSAWRP